MSVAHAYPAFLSHLIRRYGWDMRNADAAAGEPRILLRTLDIGTWDDILELERLVERKRLARLVENAPPGALNPRSWAFWHYRLGLTEVGRDPPPLPARKAA